MRLLIIIIGLVCLSFSAWAQRIESMPEGRRIPIVVYTPFDFFDCVNDAFMSRDVDAYVVSDTAVYYYRNDRPFQKALTRYQKREYRRPNYGMSYFRPFREVMAQYDSVFVFTFFPASKVYADYIGILHNERLSFMDKTGKRFDNLEALTVDVFGDLESFYDIQTRNFQNELYFGKNNGINEFIDLENALDQIRSDHFFRYLHKRDTTTAIKFFIDKVETYLPAASDKRLELERSSLEYLRDNPGKEIWRINERSMPDSISLMFVDIAPVLQDLFEAEDYELLRKRFVIERQKTKAAYRFLDKAVRQRGRFDFPELPVSEIPMNNLYKVLYLAFDEY